MTTEIKLTRPLIGIVCSTYTIEARSLRRVNGLPPTYTRAIREAGGIPVMIDPNTDADSLRILYDRLDGVLLAGGGDIDPAWYGMTDEGLVHEISPARDSAEIELTRWAATEDKPLLGICRGCQVVNVALGGTLYRDIGAEYSTNDNSSLVMPIEHQLALSHPRDHIGHVVNIEPESRLARAMAIPARNGNQPEQPATLEAEVNSMHHQALRDVPLVLRVSARAPDGIVEGVEKPDARFFVGVQWHPEELTPRSEAMRLLFAAFVKAASEQ